MTIQIGEDNNSVIEWSSPGWRYKQVAGTDYSDEYAQPGYDDSDWSVGTLPAGLLGPGVGPADGYSPAPNIVWNRETGFWIRAWVPASGMASLVIEAAIDNWLDVYWNGEWKGRIGSEIWPGYLTWPPLAFEAPSDGDNLLALRAGDDFDRTGDSTYLNVRVEIEGSAAAVRQYPRDDSRGFGSAPRIYPIPQQDNRIIGGYQ